MKNIYSQIRHDVVFFAISLALLLNVSSAVAQDNEVDFNMNQVTAHELAMLAVVVESCPTLIEVTPDYQKNIKLIVSANLPDAKNPMAELQIRSQSDELRALVIEARQIFNEMGDDANKSLCEDIRDYSGQ